MAAKSSEYGADQIQVLEGLAAPRLRPGMYIGDIGKKGYHHLLWEVVDNSVDEAMGGHCDHISVILNPDGSATVEDNGRGIPVDTYKTGTQKGKSTVEVVLTVLHAGGKFNKDGYEYSGGLHGVGISVVNALSEWTRVEVKRDSAVWEIEFGQKGSKKNHPPGGVTSPLKKIGKAKASETGTKVTFLPDSTILSHTGWDYEMIWDRLRNTAFLNPVVSISLTDARDPDNIVEDMFDFPNGLADFMAAITEERIAEYSEARDIPVEELEPMLPDPIYLEGATKGVGEWEICLQWFPDHFHRVRSFVNSIETPDGGTHVDGFNQSITRIMNNWAQQNGYLDEDGPNLEAQDIRSGMGLIVSAKVPDPMFEGQTKGKLGNEKVKGMIRTGVSSALLAWFEEHPAEIEVVLLKAISEMRLRKKLADDADKARMSSEPVGNQAASRVVPTKLKDCLTKDRSQAELFIIEGDSAEGTVIMGRNRETQAVLPIRGKIINAAGAHRDPDNLSRDAIWNNREIQDIINAIGAGSEDFFELDKARYSKVIILADADVDGRHIQLLLTTLFWTLMPELIYDGRLYVARSPLYSCQSKQGVVYIYNDAEKTEYEKKNGPQVWVRYKGLGEMDASHLRKTSLDPETRRIVRVVVSDDAEAQETMEGLMLPKNAEYRYNVLADVPIDLEAV